MTLMANIMQYFIQKTNLQLKFRFNYNLCAPNMNLNYY